ncbi:MAG: tetratricopeptide repeat protein [Saprospirales bacterium]|nr:tetratricopeptide repeat protein [Saprospirales bacterium]
MLLTQMVLADSYLATQQPEKAMASYDRVLEVHPDYTLARNNRGFLLLRDKKLDEAVLDFSNIIARQPDNKEALTARAAAYTELRETQKAETDFSKVRRIDPEAKLPVLKKWSRTGRSGGGRRWAVFRQLAVGSWHNLQTATAEALRQTPTAHCPLKPCLLHLETILAQIRRLLRIVRTHGLDLETTGLVGGVRGFEGVFARDMHVIFEERGDGLIGCIYNVHIDVVDGRIVGPGEDHLDGHRLVEGNYRSLHRTLDVDGHQIDIGYHLIGAAHDKGNTCKSEEKEIFFH